MQTKIGETVKSENIEVKTSKDLKTVFGGSALLGVEAEVNWSKVAQGLSEIIKSVKDLWK